VSENSNRLAEMTAAANSLTAMYMQALNSRPVVSVALDSPAEKDAAETLAACANAMMIMSGQNPAPDGSNLWEASQVDDTAFAYWQVLAQGTGDVLSQLTKRQNAWSLSSYLTSATKAVAADIKTSIKEEADLLGNEIKGALPDKTDLYMGAGFIVVVLVLIVVIKLS
jgi:hypothetical protein